MDTSTENSTEKSLQKASEKKPVSVYSVKFTKVINNFAEAGFVSKQKNGSDKVSAHTSFSKRLFRWRNAAAVTAILAIGVLHFVFQISFIRSEIGESWPLAEVPPVNLETGRAAPVEASESEVKKIDAALPPKTVRVVRQRPLEPSLTAPSKPQLKKREAVENRAARLRRAERILTGV
jgi:hypothetical protein